MDVPPDRQLVTPQPPAGSLPPHSLRPRRATRFLDLARRVRQFAAVVVATTLAACATGPTDPASPARADARVASPRLRTDVGAADTTRAVQDTSSGGSGGGWVDPHI